jgi:SAM-dependent methyltransferase
MAIIGEFNTDTDALEKRINSHEKFGSADIDDWIFTNLEISPALSIVDLGCGTGKQTIPMSKLVGKEGKILSVDISQESLYTLLTKAGQINTQNIITHLCCGLDDIHNSFKENSFDRILSSFSLYYSQNPYNVIGTVYTSLKNGGIFFFCGPSKDNNAELKSFHNKIKGINNSQLSGGALFMEETGQEITKEIFSSIEIFHFENKLNFDSPEALYSYWSSYNLYDREIENNFIAEAKRHFKENNAFETTKRVLGIKAKKV